MSLYKLSDFLMDEDDNFSPHSLEYKLLWSRKFPILEIYITT